MRRMRTAVVSHQLRAADGLCRGGAPEPSDLALLLPALSDSAAAGSSLAITPPTVWLRKVDLGRGSQQPAPERSAPRTWCQPTPA